MRTSIQYTLLRLLIFFVCVLLLGLIPALRENVIWLLILATTVSMLISVFALNSMRNRMSMELTAKLEERHRRREEKRIATDADERLEDLEDEQVSQPPSAGHRV